MIETIEMEIVQADDKLIKYAGQAGLEPTATQTLVDAFRPVFAKAREAVTAAAGVAESVKDATCLTEIRKSRACRLAIRAVRIEGEKVHKEQKQSALIYGRAVDGFKNILLADLAPIESALQNAEDTAERAEQARKDALEQGRKAALAPFMSPLDMPHYDIRDMAEPAFAALLTGVRVAKEQAAAAVAKVEADRIAKEKEEAAERERIRAENVRLRAELARSAKAAADAKDKLEAEARAAALAAKKAAAAPDAAKLVIFAGLLRRMETPILNDEATLFELKQRVKELAAWCEGKAQND